MPCNLFARYPGVGHLTVCINSLSKVDTRIDSLAKINAHMSSSNISLNSDILRYLAYLERNTEVLHKIL
jgi:hypothetical protein